MHPRIPALLAALLLAVTATPSRAQLLAVDTPRLHLGSDGGGTETSFLVASTRGTVTDASVTVRSVRDPRGRNLAASLVEARLEAPRISAQGTRVDLSAPHPERFATPGEYRVLLMVSGRLGGTAVQLLQPVQLQVEAGQVGLSGLASRTVRLKRWFPGASASGSATFTLENPGRSTLAELSAWGDAVQTRNTGLVAPGTVTPELRSSTLPPGGTVPLRIDFGGFTEAGEYTTTLGIRSPALDSARHVTLNVQVTDHALFPTVAIFLGVLLAAWARTFTQGGRAQLENRYRIVTVRAELERLLEQATEPVRRSTIQGLLRTLRGAEDENELGRTTVSAERVTLVEQELQKLFLADEQRARELGARLAALRERSTQLRTAGSVPKADIDTLDAALEKAGAALRDGPADAAALVLDQADAMESAARKKFPQFRGDSVAAPTAPALIVVDPPEARTARRELSFRVDDPGTLLQTGDMLAWDFGDGAASSPGAGRTARHRFTAAGTYHVAVSVRRRDALTGETEVFKPFVAVQVQPVPADVERRGIMAGLRRSELVLECVAVVLAVATGLWVLYAGKVFGTAPDYLAAFLWGFGIDSGVRGFTDVLKKVGA